MGYLSYFTDHPRARWAAPASAVAVIGAITLVGNHTASADAGLPARSAAQLLVDVQQAKLGYLSGTVVQSSDLGLPDLSGLGGPGGGGSSSLESTVSGTHTWRVWYGGQNQQRLALVGSLGESDIIRNGTDLWVWSSKDKTAQHRTLAPHDSSDTTSHPSPSPTDLPKTPQEAAQRALAALQPTTEVTTSGTDVVAGRSAYDLVLKPRDAASLVGWVRIAIDAQRHLPLRVQVYSRTLASPAFEVGFTSIDFARPDARQFVFNPPPGTTVTQAQGTPSKSGTKPDMGKSTRPRVVGKGWTSVMVGTLPTGSTSPGSSGPDGSGLDSVRQLQAIVDRLPMVSGSWGSGRLLQGTLFSAVLTDDGRFAVGAVAPTSLYAALAAK